MRKRFRALEGGIDLRWRALLSRGRHHQSHEKGDKPPRRGRRNRREAMEADVTLFLRQYAQGSEVGRTERPGLQSRGRGVRQAHEARGVGSANAGKRSSQLVAV